VVRDNLGKLSQRIATISQLESAKLIARAVVTLHVLRLTKTEHFVEYITLIILDSVLLVLFLIELENRDTHVVPELRVSLEQVTCFL